MSDTVKRADLFGAVRNTFQTEGELNGWRSRQQQLFDRDEYKERPAPTTDPRQASMFREGEQ